MILNKSYREFWKNQTTPLHRMNDEKTYKAYAQELSNIFSYLGYFNGKILEIGCGNGALFPFFDFDHRLYTGIDFSPSLMKIFRANYPNVSLIECDAADFIPDDKYNLIFGNAVHQHFSKKMLTYHVKNMLSCLTDGGALVLANVPYSKFRNNLFYGELFPNSHRDSLSIKSLKRRLSPIYQLLTTRSDGIGFWYSIKDIQEITGENYTVDIFGSNFYPYRVHFGIKKTLHDNEGKI